jgi:hypothetical protein
MERLETPRLILRPFEDGTPPMFRIWPGPRVGPAAGWRPHRDQAESLAIIRTVFAQPGVFALE